MNATPPASSSDRTGAARFFLAILALVLVVGMAIAGVWVVSRMGTERRSHTTILPDGTRVEFLGLTHAGKVFTTDKSWVKAARHILPARFQGWLPPAYTGEDSFSNSIVLCITPVTKGRPFSPTEWFAEDDAGFRYWGDGRASESSLSSGQFIHRLNLPGYPRRQREFNFGVLSSSGAVDATSHVFNPSTGPFPAWHSVPVPQTVTHGPVTLTLRSLETHGTTNWPLITPRWTLFPLDPAWTNAAVVFASLLDATGNESRFSLPVSTRGSTNASLAAHPLSPRETAWKVRALVRRTKFADFAPAEKMVVTNLPLQATNEFLAVDRSNIVSGVKINVSVLSGPHGVSRAYTNYGPTRPLPHVPSGSKSFFLVETADLQPNDEIGFFLRDNLGRDISINANAWLSDRKGVWVYEPMFYPLPDAKSVTLEVIVDRPLVFEFMVNPADVLPLGR